MRPPRRRGSTSARALVALAAIIVILLISVLGNETLSPGKWHQQFKAGLGLDLSSGANVVLKAETRDGKPPASGEVQQARTVLLSRVNGTGNSGAQAQQQGSDTINVTVPGTPSYNVVNRHQRPARTRSPTATPPSSTPRP